MTLISITEQNIDKEHICCAISDKKCQPGYLAKKELLKQRFKEGYIFKRADVNAKVFMEYGPAEHAWAPVEAPGYMMINCFWVSGSYKGKGYGKQLYQECLNDSKDKDGIVILTGDKKRPFMSDKSFFKHQGFELCDTALPYFELWYKKLKKDASIPHFKEIAKKGKCNIPDGLSVYYTANCPFTQYYVNTELARIAKEKNIPINIIKLENKEQAQNHFIPYTNYSVFYNGNFITQELITQSKFDKIIKL